MAFVSFNSFSQVTNIKKRAPGGGGANDPVPGSVWVVAGTQGALLWSTDVVNWNMALINGAMPTSTTHSFKYVEFSRETQTYLASSNGQFTGLYRSIDGSNWSTITSPALTFSMYSCITYTASLGIWVALANGGGSNSIAVSSDNGLTWSGYTGPGNNNFSLCYGNGLWVWCLGLATAGNPILYTTTNLYDSASWTGRLFTTTNVYDCAFRAVYANGIWVGTAGRGGTSAIFQMYSTDGITWTKATTQVTGANLFQVNLRYDPIYNQWLSAPFRNGAMRSTDNGLTWKVITPNPFTRQVYDIRRVGNYWVACNDSLYPASLMTSTDNYATWTQRQTQIQALIPGAPTAVTMYCVVYAAPP